MSIDKCKPRTQSERVNVSDLVTVYKLDSKWKSVRFLDVDHLAVPNHWIDIVTKDGKETRFPKICLAWDPKTEELNPDLECPYCDEGLTLNTSYYLNAIIRDIQEEEPANQSKPTRVEKETGFKAIDSKTWTPVQVLQLTPNTVAKIQGLKELNKHKIKGELKAMSTSHKKYGMDINILYDEKAKTAADRYKVNSGEKTAIREDEEAYLTWDLGDDSLLKRLGQEDLATAKADVKRLKLNGIIGKKSDVEEDDDDDDLDLSASKKKPSKKSRFEDDDDDDDDDDEPKKKPSKKSRFEDDDDDDEPKKKPSKKRSFDDDDDDEPKKKPSKKSRFEDDDEDDEPKKKPSKKSRFEDDDEDEDDDEPKKKPSKKSRFEDDDDDDDEPKKKPSKKSRFEDDDDDDEPKKKPSKKRSFDDDDDDD